MPLISQVRIDLMLTNISVQFKNPGYIAEDICPIIPVKLESSKYFVYDKTRFDAPPAKRMEKAQYGRVDWATSTDNYACEEYGLELLIDDRERANAIDPLNIDIDSTEILTDMVMNDREIRVKNLITTAATYATANKSDLTGLASAWDQFGTSDPIHDVAVTAREAVRASCAQYPNVVIMSGKTFSTLKNHPLVIDRLKYGQTSGPAKGSLQALADLFEVDKILVGLPLYRSSNENQTDTLADIWGTSVVVAWINPRPAIKQPSLCYQFQARPRQIEKYRDDLRKSDVIRCSEVVDEKIVSASCGYLFSGVTS